ncbi:MAG: undecaprenyl-diphosphatase UppP [Elusimicrobia bacterium RIFOXYD2_FULL_34_15]|nr:MAG: undecaprenyl-diphosphatase UppP [Elusimicrobia bacterium RIFOXYD2_FULL_34_15]
MNFLSVAILSVVEGISEFLPISSTAHLILTAHLLKLHQTEFLKSFEIAIQLGAILSVVVLYGKRFLLNFHIWKRIITAFFPTAIIGLVFYKTIKNVFFNSNVIILWSLFLGGIFLIIFELFHHEKENSLEDISSISFLQAFMIGVFQSIAVIPGVSRAAATIVGGLILGLKRKTIVEFSFLLAVPTMGAAVGLDLLKNASMFTADNFLFLLVGFILSFIVAFLSIKFLLGFIKNHSFISFGVYRIILVLCFLLAKV